MSNVESVRSQARTATRSQRFWEVDAVRGVAIVMMVIYHLMWDLWVFGVLPNVVLWAGFWKYFQRTTATLFITLVGVSLTISYNRALASRGSKGLYWKFFKRGLMIFGLGMLITVVLWALQTAGLFQAHIEFGVLHLIGFSIIVAYPFLRFRWLNFFLWMAFFVAGWFVQQMHVDTTWLVWLGLTPVRYTPVDFFPVIPWFGVVLLGIFLGNTLYPEGIRSFPLVDYSTVIPVRVLDFLGRHSLLIYMIHQPILFAILMLIGVAGF
jgi:uncharacterized membrane protein